MTSAPHRPDLQADTAADIAPEIAPDARLVAVTFDRDGAVLEVRAIKTRLTPSHLEACLRIRDGREPRVLAIFAQRDLVPNTAAEWKRIVAASESLPEPARIDTTNAAHRTYPLPPTDDDAPGVTRAGHMTATFRGRGRPGGDVPPVSLAVTSWDMSTAEFQDLRRRLSSQFESQKVQRSQRLDLLLARLYRDEQLPTSTPDESLDRSEERIRGWEALFQTGSDFNSAARDAIEEEMRILVEDLPPLVKPEPKLEGRRVGLESRLVRLLDAQAQRDAAGPLQRAAATLTTLVLIPGVVAAVFGANVGLPLQQSRPGLLAMLALMAGAAAVSHTLFNLVRYDPSDGNLKLLLLRPSRVTPTTVRIQHMGSVACVLLGGSIGLAMAALVAAGSQDMWAPTTHLTVGGLAIIEFGLLLYGTAHVAVDQEGGARATVRLCEAAVAAAVVFGALAL